MRRLTMRFGTALLFSTVLSATSAAPARAQGQVEASGNIAYVSSEGINSSQSRIIQGQVYNSIDITRGFGFGFGVGVFVTKNWEVEFLLEDQKSSLEISNPAATRKVANMNVQYYHANLVYNFYDSSVKAGHSFLAVSVRHDTTPVITILDILLARRWPRSDRSASSHPRGVPE